MDFDAEQPSVYLYAAGHPDRRPGAGSGPALTTRFLAEFSKYRAEAGDRRQASRKRRFNVWKMQHPIGDLMTTTMQKLREIADVNTIVGKPILAGEITIIPISKLTVGFASGGSDFTSKNQKPEDDNSFGGGSGAGMNLSPVAFLIVKGDSVRLMPVAPPPGTAVDRVVEMVPDVIDKVTGFIEKQQDKDKSQG